MLYWLHFSFSKSPFSLDRKQFGIGGIGGIK